MIFGPFIAENERLNGLIAILEFDRHNLDRATKVFSNTFKDILG